jgi:hypothetical protein
MRKKFLWISFLVVWTVAGWAVAADETDYFAILSDGSKIGYSIHTRSIGEGKVTTADTVSMSAERLGAPLTMAMTEEHTETADGKPLTFKCMQDLSLMSQTVEGRILPGGKMLITSGAAGQPKSQTTLDWPAGALMSEGAFLLQKRYGLKEGLTYSYTEFDAMSLHGRQTTVQVIGRKPVDILGRKETLWETLSMTEGVAGTVYLNDDFKLRKTVSAQGGMNIEIVACTQEFALSENATMDLTNQILVESPQPLNNLKAAGGIAYHFEPNGQAKLVVPNYDNQKVRTDPSGLTVTVMAQNIPSGVAFPYAGNDPRALAALKPTVYLESQNPQVVALARQAVGTTKDAAEATRRIEAFVRDYITTKDYAVGYASAGEVVKTRRGDCTEHAVLGAALCRAVGIPARVVAGIAYVNEAEGFEHVFGHHAWFMAYLNGQWIHFDAMFPNGYDVGHIAFAAGDGSPGDYTNIVTLMGNFRIDSVTILPRAAKAAPAATSQRGLPR